MSLEVAINRNSELLEKHNALIEKLIGAAAAKASTASAGDGDKGDAAPKTSAKAKGKDKGDDGPTFASLKKDLAAWLGEFAKDEDKDNPEGTHPEVTARKAALAKAFKSEKLQIGKLPEIEEDAAKIKVLHTWLHETAKKADKGFGIGRLVADPEPDEDGDGEDDDGMGI